jgi:hypothetical protein
MNIECARKQQTEKEKKICFTSVDENTHDLQRERVCQIRRRHTLLFQATEREREKGLVKSRINYADRERERNECVCVCMQKQRACCSSEGSRSLRVFFFREKKKIFFDDI